MNLKTILATNNNCYKTGRKHTPAGIMWHSTGANNPNLKRYVAPDIDGTIGKNQYNNDWNRPLPEGKQICAHGFIGKLADGSVATCQLLPWDMVGWHSGSGSKGSANYMGYIGIEVCEDDKHNLKYFKACVEEFIELCVYLCKEYGIDPKNITTHKDGHDIGIASNHIDPYNWIETLIKDGHSVDEVPNLTYVRNEVTKRLKAEPPKAVDPQKFTRVYIGEFSSYAEAFSKYKEVAYTYPGAFVTTRVVEYAGVKGTVYTVQIGAFADHEYGLTYQAEIPLKWRSDSRVERR